MSDPATENVIEVERPYLNKWRRAWRWGIGLVAFAGAVGLGWYAWEARREGEIRRFVSEYRKRGGVVTQRPVQFMADQPVLENLFPSNIVNVKGWVGSANLFFYRERVSVLSGAPLLSSDFGVISQIRDVDALTLPGTRLTPELIDLLAGLPHLKTLSLPDSGATDEALATLCHKLEGRPELAVLLLGRSQVTENGMKELRLLRHLRGATVYSPLVKNSYQSFLATRKESSRIPLR